MGLVDFDVVDESNLQRQIAHGTSAIGRPKLDSMRERLADLNPHVEVITHETRLDRDNALEILGGYDIVLDGTDNFATRYLVNDACVLLGLPNVYGSILRFEGQASVFDAVRGPCYRCLFPQPPPPGLVPSCAEAGVLGVLPGVIGTIQATETVKLLLGAPDTLVGRLLLYDAWTMRFRELVLRKDPACAWCGENPTMRALVDYDELCGTLPPAAPGAAASGGAEMTPRELRELRERGEDHVLLDVREAGELALSRLGGETHIPLGQLPQRFGELDPARRTVVLCHHGMRSAQAVSWLRARGFGKLHNLAGGIDAYSHEVDPAVPRY
jgi:adenylyltransferase/sulfurtransferase